MPQSNSLPSEQYRVGDSTTYQTLLFAPAAPPPPPAAVRAEESKVATEAAKVSDRPTEKRAVWIVHGMGQQVPFETVDSVAQGLLGVARLMKDHPPLVTEVKFLTPNSATKEQVVQRIELDVEVDSDADQKPRRYQLHLYEAYWAPVAEGVAKVSDVVSFLFDGGMRSILNWRKPFFRALFPGQKVDVETGDVVLDSKESGTHSFNTHFRTPLYIGSVLLVLLALTWVNTVVLAAAASKVSVFDASIKCNWLPITSIASAMAAVAITFGVFLFVAVSAKPAQGKSVLGFCISGFSWLAIILTSAVIVFAASLMMILFKNWVGRLPAWLAPGQFHPASLQFAATLVILLAAAFGFLAAIWQAVLRSENSHYRDSALLAGLFWLAFVLHFLSIPFLILAALFGSSLLAWIPSCLSWLTPMLCRTAPYGSYPGWVWPALIFASAQVRTILVQFPGDVAIYVASQKLDRFDKVRKEIKQIAFDSLSAIYTAVEDGVPVYSKIAVVGHSLGSVIAYDTLNKLLNLDDLATPPDDPEAPPPIGIARRTCLFETFGSPLDKIAFFFTIQGKESHHFREKLAAVVQPLIQNYKKFREGFPWINVYSRNDIVSGSLDFYDLPALAQDHRDHVQNVVDPDAVVPLVAHVDYWRNKCVWKHLYEELTRVTPR